LTALSIFVNTLKVRVRNFLEVRQRGYPERAEGLALFLFPSPRQSAISTGKQSSLFAPEREASSALLSLCAVKSLPLEVSDVSYLESTRVKILESTSVTILESTLTQPPATVDSNRLRTTLSPLSATLAKNIGGGVVMVNQKSLCRCG